MCVLAYMYPEQKRCRQKQHLRKSSLFTPPPPVGYPIRRIRNTVYGVR